MYTGLLHLHSALRYVVLLLLIITAIRSLLNWMMNNHYKPLDNKLALFSMIALHVQLLIGIGLYFISPNVLFSDMGAAMKDAEIRFWTVEHTLMMLIAIVLITIGRSTSKKARSDILKHKRVAIFFWIGLLIIFFSIPWPFLRDLSRGWF